ncbi:MAG: radical SAM protein [Acidobacteria bacterium]|nr:radical SAM protein [Acidobacteriota bacterium]
MKRPQVLFHQLPPIRPHDPDIAYPILKGFLARHRVPSCTIYWNLLMRGAFARLSRYRADLFTHLESSFESRELLFYLSPFLLELLRREHTPANRESATAIHHYLASLIPDAAVQDPLCLHALVDDVRHDLLAIMAAEIQRMELEDVLLWGISCKSGQWVPGLLLTEIAMRCRPDLPVVLGGLPSEAEARTLMAACPSARFAIWGEGEQPLLALVRQVERPDPDWNAVPRLLYRHGAAIVATTASARDLDPLGEDDYTDYFGAVSKMPPAEPPAGIQISLNTARGCPWAGCRFCSLHQNLPYRAKAPRLVVNELRQLATRFDVKRVHVADQDCVRPDRAQFIDLLDQLAAMRQREGIRVDLSADVSPMRLDAADMERMACAGFDCLLVGFEALTDELLGKMHKAHRFAHNVHFLKFADKYRIRVVCNVLQDIPGETRADVLESAANLHFLRFYPPGLRGSLWISPMRLSAGAPFASALSAEERTAWDLDDVFSFFHCLPARIRECGDRLHLGSFVRPVRHQDLWDQFRARMDSYRQTRREYRWVPSAAGCGLHELFEGTVVKEFSLDDSHALVLRAANDRVVSFDALRQALAAEGFRCADPALRDVVRDLRRDALLYCDDAMETVISVVDTSLSAPRLS